MKILVLGNSADTGDYVPPEQRAPALIAKELERIFGQPFELVVKGVWPDAGLAEAVDRWVGREEPDIVYFNVVGWWMTHESVPLRIQRLLGPLGRPTAGIGFRMADSPWLVRTRMYHWGRRLLERTIGGDPHFTGEEVAESIMEAVRVVLRHEGTTPFVKGPEGRVADDATRGSVRRGTARRRRCTELLKAACAEAHVAFGGFEGEFAGYREHEGRTVGDRLHPNEVGQRVRLERQLPRFVEACEAHGLVPLPASRAPG